MKSAITRRDFLKLVGLLSLGYALPQYVLPASTVQTSSKMENVLIVVFDAWSAANISLYGYERKTTPHLERLAEKAIVYHHHYSAGNFTTPGTTSILTGTLPWTHRALGLNGIVDNNVLKKSIFDVFQPYHRLAYTHNPLVDVILRQFLGAIDDFIPWQSLYLESDYLISTLFKGDTDAALVGWNRTLKHLEGYSYSLYLSQLYRYFKRKSAEEIHDIIRKFPLGLPNHDDYTYFTLEQGIDWLSKQVSTAPQPFLGYYHFFPPHDPYHTRADYYGTFAEDSYQPPIKPDHLFRGDRENYVIPIERSRYDEFVLYVDAEFARLYDSLEQSGLLENTWLILTTDHGEMFERGILGHLTRTLYQPVIHTPLLIFPPGQKERVDVFDVTSAIDLLPTLSHLTGQYVPDWAEGRLLPPFADSAEAGARDVYAFHGDTDNSGMISKGTAMMVRGNHKIIWYFGHEELGEEGEMIELYDLSADPEELDNLYPAQKDLADGLIAALKLKLAEAEKGVSP